ncbi:hypothetical protein N9Y61_05005 [Paracoccaceae bacterium]|nr:hypothetical protein [Paracoccaceae bacterium]
MRSIGRRRREEDDEESVFVPMTDMTVSFLFIVMILLAFFAVQFSDEDNVPRSIYEEVVAERNELIEKVKLLNIEISKLKKLINELELENSNLKNLNAELTQENSRLDRELSVARDRILELESIIASLEAELELTLKRNEELTSDKEKLVARIQELYDEINALLEIIDQKDELLRSKDDRIAFLERIITALYDKVSEKDLEISQLEEELEELKAKLKDDPLEAYLIESQLRRSAILSEIERKLKIEFPDILVEVSPENDALRFKGDGLFTSGSSQLSSSKRRIVEKVGVLVTEAIECFTINPRKPDYKSCNPDGILIEAIQIEGHTDNSRFVGADGRDRNIELSAKRATSAFFAMQDAKPELLTYQNLKRQPVISIAGYGDMRPVNMDPKMKAENRRIDLRLIMFTPTSRVQINAIQKKIESDLEILLEELQ